MEDYEKEINILKQKISEKEEYLAKIKTKNNLGLYIKYNKDVFDKVKQNEQRNLALNYLNSQITEKNLKKSQEIQKKEEEIKERLKDLNRQKQDTYNKVMQNIAQAKEYKRDLDAQKHLESFIKQEEKQNLRSDPSVLSKSQAKPFSYPNFYTSQSCFTKKYPKTIFYNPITGDLQDMSNFLNGKFPQKPVSESTDSLFLPVFKNNNKVAPVFSTLKAFQQPRYTKNHPKYVSSFPITGSNFSKDYSELRNSQNVLNYGKFS